MSPLAQPPDASFEKVQAPRQDARQDARQDPSAQLGSLLEASPRIAVYRDSQAPPIVEPLQIFRDPETPPTTGSGGAGSTERPGGTAGRASALPAAASAPGGTPGGGASAGAAFAEGAADGASAAKWAVPQLIELLTARSYSLAREQGGVIPIGVFRELIENLVHASFKGVVITILDRGNTVRVSDQGPGIPDKDAALRPGFTSAGADAKQYIRGVGSGFSVVRETLAGLGGTLNIEDNLGKGTVVTARVPPPAESPLAPAPAPEYNLPERQLKVLLLTVELAPVGPTRIAQELGVSTSTAYRDLVSLEEAGFVVCRPSGHRSATDAGFAHLGAVL
jgi:anti-sigma regulatory factor (Ser/Thr protein kinase)